MQKGKQKIAPKQILDVVGVIIVTLDKDGNVTTINKYGCKILGYSKKEMLGKNWFDNFVPLDLRDEIKKIHRLNVSNKLKIVEYYENLIITKNGEEKIISWHNDLLRDGKRKIIGTLSSGLDITESRKINEALKVNKSAGAYGYTEKEAIGKNLGSLIIPRDIMPLYKKGLQAGKKAKKSGEFLPAGEVRLLKKDGSFVDVYSTHVVVKNKNKELEMFCIDLDLTERKQAEESLKESESRYNNIIIHSNQLFYIHDTKHVLSYSSPQSKKMLGYTPSEMLVKWTKLTTNNPINKIGLKLTVKALKTGERQKPYLLELKHKNGSHILVEVHESPIKDESGKVIGITGALVDITEKKKAEEKYKSLVNTLKDIVYVADQNGVMTFVTPNVQDYGYKAEEIIGKSLSYFVHPKDLGKVIKDFEETLKTGREFPTQFRLKKKNGDYVVVEDFGARIIGENGEITVHGVLRDLTDIQRAEEKYKVVSENTPDCMKILDLNGNVVYLNDAAIHNHEVKDPNTANGKSFLNIMAKENRQQNLKAFNKAKKGESVTDQFIIQKKDEKPKYILRTFSPIKDDKGKVVQVHMICRNITKIKEAEIVVKESQEQYKSLVDNLPGAVYKCANDKNWTMSYISDGIEDLTGYLPSDFIDNKVRSYASIIHPNDREMVEEKVRKAVLKKEFYVIQYRIIDFKGKSRWIYEKGRGVFDKKKLLYLQGVFLDITNEKIIEEKYESVIKNATEIILVVQDGKIVMTNPRTMEISGFLEKELTSNPFTEFIHPDDREMVVSNHVRRLKGENIPPYDFRILKKKGGYFWVQITAVVLKWDGKPAILTFLNDITARKAAEERFKMAAQVTSDFIYEWDPKTNKLEWFGKLDEALGYNYGEIPRTISAWLEIIHPDDRDALSKAVTRHMKDLSPIDEEYRVVRKNGDILYWYDRGNPVLDSRGNLLKWIGGCTDITERKKAERAQIESEEKYRTLVNNSPDCIKLFDLDGNLQYISPGGLKEHGLQANSKELENWDPISTIVMEDRPKFLKAMKDARQGKVSNIEIKHIESKSDREYCLETITPIRDNADKIVGVFGVSRDISKQKVIEEALRVSGERHRALFESAYDAIMTLEPQDWSFTSGNPATIKMFKCKDEKDFTSRGPWQLSPLKQPDGTPSGKKAKAMIMKAMKEGSNFFEWTHRRATGEDFPATVLLTRMIVGDKTFLQATVRDITEQRESEEAIQKNLSLLSATLESTADGILVVDMKGRWSHYNTKFLDMWKIPKNIAKSKDDKAALDYVFKQLENPKSFINKVQELYKKPKAISFDTISFKDGRVFERYSKPQISGKKILGRVWSFRDVTKQIEANEAIKQAESKYRDIVENSPEMIHSIDENGYIVFANSKEYQLLGYKPDELIGMHMSKLYSPELMERVKEGFEALKKRGELYISASQMIKKNGDLIDVEIFSIAIYDGAGKYKGKFVRTRSIIRDITEQQKARLELTKLELGFERSDQIMFMTGIDGKINHVNPAFT
ncbi:PAS domain S-box protein, partial [Patescibacteria group bacterium]|nr:PAS domain S-box protein [Patescibacteria group bacterium]